MFIKLIWLKSIFHVHAFICLRKRESIKSTLLQCNGVFSYHCFYLSPSMEEILLGTLFSLWKIHLKHFSMLMTSSSSEKESVCKPDTVLWCSMKMRSPSSSNSALNIMLEVTEHLWIMHLNSNEKILTDLFHFILLYPAVDQKEGAMPF